MKETIKIILNHKVDLGLIAILALGFIIGVRQDAPTITNGGCLFGVGYIAYSIANKVKLIKSGVLDKLKK
jgi:hypothetical protein